MKLLKTFALVTLLAAATAGVASAQQSQQPPQQAPAGPGYGYMMGPWMMEPDGMMANGRMGPWMMGWNDRGTWMCTAMAGHIDGRLAYAKTELKITGAQEPLWTAYANAARDNAQNMVARCTTMMGQGAASLGLPDRLDLQEQFMTAQLDAVRAMNKAVKPLYAAFDDAQKQTANQLFWGPMGMMGMM